MVVQMCVDLTAGHAQHQPSEPIEGDDSCLTISEYDLVLVWCVVADGDLVLGHNTFRGFDGELGDVKHQDGFMSGMLQLGGCKKFVFYPRPSRST